MRKIETIKLIAGETPMGTLTMATHPPRRKRAVRVLRERDYIYLLRAARSSEAINRDADHVPGSLK